MKRSTRLGERGVTDRVTARRRSDGDHPRPHGTAPARVQAATRHRPGPQPADGSVTGMRAQSLTGAVTGDCPEADPAGSPAVSGPSADDRGRCRAGRARCVFTALSRRRHSMCRRRLRADGAPPTPRRTSPSALPGGSESPTTSSTGLSGTPRDTPEEPAETGDRRRHGDRPGLYRSPEEWARRGLLRVLAGSLIIRWKRLERVAGPQQDPKQSQARVGGTRKPLGAGRRGPLTARDRAEQPPMPAMCGRRRAWTRVLMYLACGWAACSDDSHGGHARAHHQETDHPVVTALEPRSTWRWCYVHRRTL
ncbi:UBP-type zinc finger domain-containing protein [Nonomuraea sp. M3C6]|uniref:UBP-type zinc finger domain-containing protein n=1 Tax=Nonomuraea marmarensis TaxID=3351344 RepID=A0ABW7ANM3_9ACTN